MKLFSSTQISWSEPLFFLVRIREAWGWRWRILLAMGISILMFLAMYFLSPVQRGLAECIGISLLAGFVLIALLDFSNMQRDVTVSDDSIIVSSNIGRGWFKTFKFAAMKGVELMRPAEWGKPYGGMLIVTADDDYLVAVPKKVSLDTLADVLNRLGVTVALSGWEPSTSDKRIAVRNEVEINPAAVRGEIAIQPVGPDEAPLLAPSHIAIQVIIAFGPLLLALIGAIVVGVVVYRNWAVMSVLEKGLYGVGALAAFIAAFVYLIMVGQFVAASYGVRVARSRLPTRPNAMFAGTEDDLVAVEIFDRPSWTAAISQSADYGFLRIDRPQAKLLFSGNKFRWTLPISALTACRIEESVVVSEGNANAEKRYFVVLAANNGSKPWEAGLVYTRTEVGSDTAESRYKRAQLLFRQLADVV